MERLRIISVTTSKKGFYTVKISNGTSLDCIEDIIVKYKLYKDFEIDEKVIEEIRLEQRRYWIRRAALNYATFRQRTEKQVRDKLISLEYTKAESDYAISLLKEFGYINDLEFACMFVRDYLLRKSASQNKILIELAKKGINRDFARQAVNEFYPAEKKHDILLKLASKKLKLITTKPPEKQKKSMIAYLQRQGFEWDLIKVSLPEIFHEK